MENLKKKVTVSQNLGKEKFQPNFWSGVTLALLACILHELADEVSIMLDISH